MQTIKKMCANNHVRTLSLFSGAGGLDIGAIMSGAHIFWANDMMKEACMSYSKNIGAHIHIGDINQFIPSLSQFEGLTDLVIGGPPCQGFSVAGKMSEDDKRSKLIWSYASAIEAVKPKAFIMENVKALGTLNRWQTIRTALLNRLQGLGYSVNICILNAADFNVPQARERIFIIGFKGKTLAKPDLRRMLKPYEKKAKSVREALASLDRAGTGNNKGVCRAKVTLAVNPVLRKSPYAGMLFNGLGRPLKLDGYSATLPASMGGNKTPIIDENALYSHSRPWVEAYHERLMKGDVVAKEESVPGYLRRLTVEEASVLQTFPKDYEFCGSLSSQFTQIGNAVPCNLAKAVCSMVVSTLLGKTPIIYDNGLFN